MKKIQDYLGGFFKKKNLAVCLKDDYLYLALTTQKGIERSESIFLRETPLEILREKTASFLKHAKVKETQLILSRSEVLQKEFPVNAKEGTSFKDSLETELDQILPYGRKEMAFGLALLQDSQALVLAVPEKYVNEKLKFLASLGLNPTEIITEDQPLFWIVEERNKTSSFLLFDSDSERTLVLLGNSGNLIFSRSFPKKDPCDPELLSELSMNLLERGIKPERVFLSGLFSQEMKLEFSSHFGIPAEALSLSGTVQPPPLSLPGPLRRSFSEASLTGQSRLDSPIESGNDKIGKVSERLPFAASRDAGIPSCFYGIHLYEKHPSLSLLPQREKIKRRSIARKRQLISTGASFALYSLSLILYFTLHLYSLSSQSQKLNQEISALLPQAKEVKEIQALLTTLSESRGSKEKTLELLRDLALTIPQAVSLKEVSVSGNRFFFKGESSNHTHLSQTVDVLAHLAYLSEIKLGETRLRKRFNEEYFEFEITGRWNP